MAYQMQQDVMFYQRFLKANGFYPYTLDGDWGPKTDAADKAFHQKSVDIAAQEGLFHARSEANIVTLTPKAQIAARKFLKFCKGLGQDVRIISGTRTYAEQDALYAQGRRGRQGPIVTNARGGQSNHNFGIAWDIGIFNGGQYITNDASYIALGAPAIAHISGIEWGGNWNRLKDYPHYQLKAISQNLAVVRTDFEAGTPYV